MFIYSSKVSLLKMLEMREDVGLDMHIADGVQQVEIHFVELDVTICN